MNPGFWKGLIIVCVLLLAVLGVSLLFVETGSPTQIVIHLGAIHLLIAVAIMSAFLYFEWDPFEPFQE